MCGKHQGQYSPDKSQQEFRVAHDFPFAVQRPFALKKVELLLSNKHWNTASAEPKNHSFTKHTLSYA